MCFRYGKPSGLGVNEQHPADRGSGPSRIELVDVDSTGGSQCQPNKLVHAPVVTSGIGKKADVMTSSPVWGFPHS